MARRASDRSAGQEIVDKPWTSGDLSQRSLVINAVHTTNNGLIEARGKAIFHSKNSTSCTFER
jgi:hypothetical protein